jgi:hypothetical protein
MSISPFIAATPRGAVAAYRTSGEGNQAKQLEQVAQTAEELASASTETTTDNVGGNATVSSDPDQELEEYMSMSSAEKRQWAWMNSRSISKEDFQAMSAEGKQSMLEQMRTELKQKVYTAEVDRSQNPPIDEYV